MKSTLKLFVWWRPNIRMPNAEALWVKTGGDGEGRYFLLERVVTHFMQAYGWEMTQGAAAQGAVAFQLRKKEAHKKRGLQEVAK